MRFGISADRVCEGLGSVRHFLLGWLAVLSLLFASAVVVLPTEGQAQTFVFNSVQVEGNRRIQSATIANYAGIKPGQQVTAGELNAAYQRILDSGVFETVELEPRGGTLVILVTEYPTINVINFEGNRRIKDEDLAGFIDSTSRRVFNPAQAERDAATIAAAYAQQGRVAATVIPRIIRRRDNRVDLIFEISEGDTIEVERISFIGNRAYSDRRLRRVLETKQAGLLRAFIRSDTLVEDRIEFDKQVLRDFYLSRGYIDFRINSVNAELTRERDAFFLVVNLQEGQQFKFGKITTTSEISGADPEAFQAALKIRPGVVYSPVLVENSIARQERLAIRKGIDFLRVEPRITRNDRDLTLDVEFVLTRGPRIFVERIDIEGNTTTLDRVIRQQFRIVEGDPFNPREIRESAERIRALGYFSTADVEARQGSASDQVIVDVDVEEQPTGTLSLGGSYSVNDGFGVAIGLSEENFLGRGQRLSITTSTAEESEQYILGFSEPYLLGRDLRFDLDVGYSERDSGFFTYDTTRGFIIPALSFPISENGRLQLRYTFDSNRMISRDPLTTAPNVSPGAVISSEIAAGRLDSSSLGFTYTYDSRLTGLNPNAGVLLQFGSDFAGLGGDNEFIRSTAKAVAQTRILNEEVTLRATLEGGMLNWRGNNNSRIVERFILGSNIMRGFEPGGIGPRDLSDNAAGNPADDALGGNLYAVMRFEADFPLGLPEELGLRGGVFYDVGNLWDLKNVNTAVDPTNCGPTGAASCIVGRNGSLRHVIGLSFLWDTAIGPLRFNFSHALRKESFDKEQSFDLTLQARF